MFDPNSLAVLGFKKKGITNQGLRNEGVETSDVKKSGVSESQYTFSGFRIRAFRIRAFRNDKNVVYLTKKHKLITPDNKQSNKCYRVSYFKIYVL
jgi:hypothetical protein